MTREHDAKKSNASISLALKRYHASRTPEQRAAWREQVSIGTSVGMEVWHAQRTPEERERTRQLQTDAAVCGIWTPRARSNKWQKGHNPMGSATPEALARREFTRVRTASIKRILKDIVELDPDLIQQAIIEGLSAPPPRSFPYLAMAAAYLDGKPIDAELAPPALANLSGLSREELFQRAIAIAQGLKERQPNCESQLTVIDITPGETK